MSEKMSNKGKVQGEMSPTVEEVQKSNEQFSQEGFSKTTDYVERQNKRQSEMSKDVKKQGYVGRYS
jgi:hypothetical protein